MVPNLWSSRNLAHPLRNDPVLIDWCCFCYSIRDSLVALLEDRFAWIYSRFEISVFYDHIFCFAFSKGRRCYRKKAVSPVFILPHSIYTTHVYIVCINEIHICRDWGRLDFSSSPSVSSDPWTHIEHPMCSVCVCARIHTRTHAHPHPHKKK